MATLHDEVAGTYRLMAGVAIGGTLAALGLWKLIEIVVWLCRRVAE